MGPRNIRSRSALLLVAAWLALPSIALAADSEPVEKGTVPFSDTPDTAYVKKHMFPLWQDKLRAKGISMNQLPPPMRSRNGSSQMSPLMPRVPMLRFMVAFAAATWTWTCSSACGTSR